MKFIITAAGLGSRFRQIGINKPKYEIIAKDHSLFYWSMISLEEYFDHQFIFIFHKDNYDEKFIKNELIKLNLKHYQIVLIDQVTDGQATTVLAASKYMQDDDAFCVFNIDTHIKTNKITNQAFLYDGNITVFNAPGEHWSFVLVDQNQRAIKTTEKIKISDHASVGLYYFKSWKKYCYFYHQHIDDVKKLYKEAYICPLYQYMIDQDQHVGIHQINYEDVICLGTPNEVLQFDPEWINKNQ